MDETTTRQALSPLEEAAWSDPLEEGVRGRVRAFIEAILEEELSAALGRDRYDRGEASGRGWRNGHRDRQVVGTFGAEMISVPRARLVRDDGRTAEWRSKGLRRYQRLTRRAEALIAGAYLAGTNTRRVRRALTALFDGAVGKDVVSRAWRKVRTDWQAWNDRELRDADIVRLILDGTVARVKIDRKATAISLLVAIGVRRDGQKVLLALKNMGGESSAAWTAFLEDMTRRGLKAPEFIIVDGASGLESALAALWPDVPVQRCTVHKHRNLLAHAPKRLDDELSNDYRDMIYAETAADVEARRKAFLRKWRLKCRAVADSSKRPATGSSPSPACRPANGNPRGPPMLSSGCTRSSDAASRPRPSCPRPRPPPMLFWALLASGQIVMRKVDGWETLAEPLSATPIDLAA